MASGEINATDLEQETSTSLDGGEQFVMFDTVKGKRAYLSTITDYVVENGEIGGKPLPEVIDDVTNGTLPNLTAGNAEQLLSDKYTTNKSPYLYRANPTNSDREYDKLIGASVAVNQLAPSDALTETTLNGITYSYSNGKFEASGKATSSFNVNIATNVPIVDGHKYLITMSGQTMPSSNLNYTALQLTATNIVNIYVSESSTQNFKFNVATGTGSAVLRVRFQQDNTYDYSFYPQVYDITAYFGSAIADRAYTLETASVGSGVAWLQSYGFFTKLYYPYNAGTLQSVKTSKHKMRDANNNVIAEYDLDDVELKGLYKLDSPDLNIYADGDTYESDGTVTRRYFYLEIASVMNKSGTWDGTKGAYYYTTLTQLSAPDIAGLNTCTVFGFELAGSISENTSGAKLTMYANGIIRWVDPSHMADTLDTYRTYLASNPIKIVYELAEPTTETADPYQNPQIAGATEEYVDGRTVEIPVGHETKYLDNLKQKIDDLPALPTTAGTYRLKVTVSGGVPTYTWEA